MDHAQPVPSIRLTAQPPRSVSAIADTSEIWDSASKLVIAMNIGWMASASADLDTISLDTAAVSVLRLRLMMPLTASAELDARPIKYGTPPSGPVAASLDSTLSVVSALNAISRPRYTTKNCNVATASTDTARSQVKAATVSALPSATSTKIGSQVDVSASLAST